MTKEEAKLALRKITTISRCLNAIRDNQFKAYGLNRGQISFLSRIYENPGINQEEISYLLKADKTTTAKALKKLEEKEFIKRIRLESDNRQWLLYPSKQLIELHDEWDVLRSSTAINSTAQLSDKELNTLIKILSKIEISIDKEWLDIKKPNNRAL